MAIQRLTVAQLETVILEKAGYSASTKAPWLTAATLYLRINSYMQRLPQKVTAIAKQMGIIKPESGPLRFDMWKTISGTVTNISSNQYYLPADYDHYIAIYENSSNGKALDVIEDVNLYHIARLKYKSPGYPEAVELIGYSSQGGSWVRCCYIWPTQDVSYTFKVDYWRIPASVSSGTDYLDIDPKYETVVAYGTLADLALPNSPELAHFGNLEKEMLLDMAMTARATG